MKRVLTVIDSDLTGLDGKTFQIHVSLTGSNQVTLYSVELPKGDRCPVILHGEQCCERVGHEGKHRWESGD